MSVTLGDKDVDVFKLYDEMANAYSKDIEGYQAVIETIEEMIAQKQKKLQDIKDKTFEMLKTSLETSPAQETPVHQQAEKFNYAGIDMKDLIQGKETTSVVEATQPIAAKGKSRSKTASVKAQSSKAARKKKTTGKTKAKKTVKSVDVTDLKCLYHPESPVLDKARQLCSSCKWKLITNDLKEYDKDPAVISFLKGETTVIPDLGQSMCPIHTTVPSYNQKTGLCKACQKKAKEIGVSDRHLTEEELNILRNPHS
jgi:hypothetical protein